MPRERVTERTFYPALMDIIGEAGGTGVQEVSYDSVPDIVFQLNSHSWLLSVKIGQDLSTIIWFPDFVIEPGQSCRVYTNEYHPESCSFSFRSGRAIWNNKGDCGYLYDAAGAMVSEYRY